MSNLGALGGSNALALGVNDLGQVTGAADLPSSGDSHTFRYTGTPGSGGAMTDMGTLPPPNGFTYSSNGNAINKSGQITGRSQIIIPNVVAYDHAVLYTDAPGSVADLGVLPGYSGATASSDGFAINDIAQVAGDSYVSGNFGPHHAFRYSGTPGNGGAMKDLGTLGGHLQQCSWHQ
jgi:probable HAF family extracellular repeat protein